MPDRGTFPGPHRFDRSRENEEARVTVRTVVALSWSLITGLVGGWLMLSPWALGEQTSGGGWTGVVRTEFFSGVGLVALALIGLLVVAVQVVAALTVRSAPADPERSATESPELESTLVAVAQALTADLLSKGSAQGGEPSRQPPDPAPRPADSRSYDGRREER
jgi:Na+-transporting methylmalonyl-CoA/oxaloacetate decarboxylase gamma subunit